MKGYRILLKRWGVVTTWPAFSSCSRASLWSGTSARESTHGSERPTVSWFRLARWSTRASPWANTRSIARALTFRRTPPPTSELVSHVCGLRFWLNILPDWRHGDRSKEAQDLLRSGRELRIRLVRCSAKWSRPLLGSTNPLPVRLHDLQKRRHHLLQEQYLFFVLPVVCHRAPFAFNLALAQKHHHSAYVHW